MRCLIIIVNAAAMLAACQSTGSDTASPSGSFALAPGETRTLRIGSTYRPVRVCNDVGSSGRVKAWIGQHLPHDMPPGVCAEDTGNQIVLSNESGGAVNGIYRTLPYGPNSDTPGGYQWVIQF
jgi:hypothetical protein